MNTRLTIFLFVIWILIFIILLYKMKSRKTDIRFVLPWILLDIVMMIITAVPGILTFFCSLFGIETPSNMLFFFGMIFLVIIAFSMSLTISRQQEQIRKLSQQLALMEEKVNGEEREK